MSNRFTEYNGVWLYTPEARALNDIETILNTPIPDISANAMRSFGFTHENYQVTELRLFQSYFEEQAQLTELPESIGDLESMHTLDVSHNLLTSLPDTIGNIEDLQKFYLDYNEFEKIPKVIATLTDLNQINFDDNLLKCIPSFITNLSYLQSFHLGGNLLTEFPTILQEMNYLRRLVLNRNKIETLAYTILDEFSRLYVLDLRGNPIPPNQVKKAKAYLKLSGKRRRKYYLGGSMNDYEDPFSIKNITKRIRSDPHLNFDKENEKKMEEIASRIKLNHDKRYKKSDKDGVLNSLS